MMCSPAWEVGIGGIVFAHKLEFGIVDDHVAVVLDAHRAADLQDDLSFVRVGIHDCSFGRWFESMKTFVILQTSVR
jgi:hypothetical protein